MHALTKLYCVSELIEVSANCTNVMSIIAIFCSCYKKNKNHHAHVWDALKRNCRAFATISEISSHDMKSYSHVFWDIPRSLSRPKHMTQLWFQPRRSVWLSSRTNRSQHAYSQCLTSLDSHVLSAANLTTPDGKRERESEMEYAGERVCESDWSVYWVIALGFVSLQVSRWVYLALVSSAITADYWK